MKKRSYLLTFAIVLIVVLYFIIASKQPLLPGYHQFFYTPSKYNKSLKHLKHKDIVTDFKQILPFWLGTRYSFYGNTTIPGEGKIACGYFVTAVLEDLGKEINRTALAQMPSEEMIKNIVETSKIQRFSNTNVSDFVEGIKSDGKGLYILGLDTHTGYILYDNSGIWFIHASGAFPYCVVKQRVFEAKIIQKSKYRVLGKLS